MLTRLGGTVVAFFYTMGPYDYISIAAVKDDETAAKYLLAVMAHGNVRTTTLRAFSEGEYRLLIQGREGPRRESETAPIAPSEKAPMRTYVALGTFTDQGRRTIRDSPKRLAAVRKVLMAYVRFEPEELKALEQTSSTALVIDSFVPERAIDPVYFENTYYLGAGKNGERGYRVLVKALEKTHRIAVGTFTWRGKTTPIAIRVHQDGLLLQRLYFADEVYNTE